MKPMELEKLSVFISVYLCLKMNVFQGSTGLMENEMNYFLLRGLCVLRGYKQG
jgi:hypothetical protein